MHRRGRPFALAAGIAGVCLTCLIGCPATSATRSARRWHVSNGASGNGAQDRPFGRLAQALNAAGPGDEILVEPGTYAEAFATVRGGSVDAPLRIRAAQPERRAVFEAPGRVATIQHPHIVLDGLILDGRYGPDDAVRVSSAANGLVIRNVEIRRAGRDCLDMASPTDVLVERSSIHHCLDATGGRRDAHGLVAGSVERLTVRDSEIHTFSGDALQFDPSRGAPGWTHIRLERLKLWLAPLAESTNGFAAGVVPGENAIDTKTPGAGRRAALTVDDVEAWGFRSGLIPNMAAFNIKERVDAVFDRVSVHHSQIGFRLRGPADAGATVSIRHAVLHHVDTGIRFEDDLALLRIHDTILGRDVGQAFRRVGSLATQLDVRELIVLGQRLPVEGADGRGRLVGPEAFVNVAADDYRLASGRNAR